MEKLNQLNQYRTQPGNIWYDPFSTATNNAVNELKSYGINPADLTPDWFNANTSWQGYLSYNGTTTTPSKPGKKASEQEKAAYALYQYQKSMDTTNAAKNEWTAAQEEINYWANRKDLNLSDDEIIRRVFGSGKKYTTLKKMDDSRSTGSPLELNEAIDYNQDSVRGAIWAARNGGGTGNIRQDIANYYLKSGNSWKDDPNISAKLNIDNLDTFSRYEVGMAGDGMDKAGVYFGVPSFSKADVEALRNNVDWEDETSVKMYQTVLAAEETTEKAEAELANLTKAFQRRLNRGFKDQNEANKWIDSQLESSDYSTLAKMDASLKSGKIMDMTRAVPYRKQMLQQMAADSIANPKKTGSEILSSYGMPVNDADDSVTRVENEKVGSSIDALGAFLSQGEKDYFDAVPGVDYAKITAGYNGIAEGMKSGMINITNHATQYAEEANGKYNKTWLGSLASRNQYERYQATADRLAAEVDDFEKKNGTQILASESIESEPIFSLDDGTQVQLIYDDETGEYEVGNVWNDMWRFGQTSPEQLAAANEKAEQLRIEQNNRANGIRTAQADAGEMDADTVKGVEEYNKKKEQLAALNGYLEENKAGYEQSIRDAEIAKANRDALGGIAAKALGVEYDPSTADSIMQFAGGWYDYESPPADGFTLIEESAGRTAEDINKEIADNNANVQDLQFVLSMLGDNAPEDLKQKINQAISDAEKQNRVYGDYMITKNPRFDYLARKGQESLHFTEMDEPVEGMNKNWFFMMSDEEKKIYYALVNTDGIDAADRFYTDIRDELQQRRQNQIEGVTKQIAESGWLGRLASEVGAVLIAPINTLAGAAYTAGVAFGADEAEMSAAKQSSHISQSMHNANVTEIKNIYGEDTTLGKALSGLYEIMYNRGNSLMNALTWGKLMPHLAAEGKVADFINSVISATPIALSAASDALESAIDRGADPTQQAIIFASTLIAESWTEGIEFGHIEEAGKLLLTKQGITTFLKNYIPNAMSEVVGESANDLIENAADYWVKYINNPDYKTQHDEAVKKALAEDDTLTPEQAEALVHQAEVDGVLHTAIISFFSPGADVVSMAGNTLTTYYGYAKEARAYNNGLQPQVRLYNSKSIRDIRLEHEAAQQEQPVRVERPAETPQTEQTEQAQPEQYPVNGPEQNTRNFRDRGAYGEAMDAYETGIMTLESAMEGNATAKAAAIASTINTGNPYMAQAAAAKLDIVLTQGLLYAGKQSNINIETLSTGLQLAALGDGMCAQIMNTGIESGMGIYDMAQQIAAAVGADMQNPSVIQGVTAGIHDARVNEEFKRLMATGLAEPAIEAQAKVDAAREATRAAEQEAEQKNNELDAARKGVSDAAAVVAADPINDGNQMTGALAKMTSAAAVAQEYAQKLDKARKDQQKVEDENRKTIETTTAYMRQQAEKTVAQQEQEEAQAKAEAEAQVAAAAEQAAAQEAEKNATEQAEEQKTAATNEEAIRNRLRELGYSDDAIERQVDRIMNRLEEKVRGTENTNAKLSDQDGDKFLRRISRKTGITYEMQDLGDPLKNRGYIVDRNHMVLNSNLTRGQALVEAALHEVTHGIEKTKAYTNYASFVLKAMYGGEGTDAYNKALRDKINEYARNGKTLTPEGARQELVAEYARLNLGKKEFARQIATQGLGGKFREILSKAISMLKGYTLDAEGRAKYQEMRTAMKLLNNAINERAQHMKESNNGHTGLVQASITGWTDATGLALEVTDDDTHVYRLLNNGEEIKPGEYTADMVKGSPVGNLIDMASQANNEALQVKLNKGRITQEEYASQLNKIAETAKQQREYVAKIINMIGQYQDAAMVWELAGSLAFSSLKTNGDPQYSDSYDFGTICTKTQAILNAISETQVRLGRALTKAEIDGVVYEEVGKGVYNKETGKWEHGATPCPPCYVYATWVNKPARLEKVRLYQQECADWTNEQINEFMNRPDPVAKTKSKAKELKTEQNTKKLWISLCLADEVTNPDTGETTWVRKDNPDICPNEILLDLRRSGEMATQHPGTWTFMQKGGNAQGKAIAPYSDARLGESIVAKAVGAGEANARLLEDERNAGNEEYIPQFLNPFLSTDIDSQEAARKIFNKAVEKIRAQNLKGGQRWQSWSDFRAEWGSDYLMEMITMQALGSQVQTYTKVVEALDLLASAGFEVNMSLMPHGDGFWHNEDGSIKIDEDGNMMLRFSPVTGINPEAAAEFAKKYGEKGNVQPMVVGISDEHIKAALAGDFITFVIPFHGSGGSVKRLQHLMSLLHEQMKTGNDYTKAQSDEFEHYRTEGEGKSKKKINTNPNWALREAILTGNYDSLNESQKDAIENNPYLSKLYTDRYIDEDSDAFHVFFSKNEAQQIYPYEYWDTNTTLATADINSQRFIEYCQMLGVKPRFSGLEKVEGKGKNAKKIEYANFSGRSVDANGNVTYNPVKGYWKLLIDRSMYNRVYDENGKINPEKCTYHKPQAVSTADINIGAMPMAANNTVGHSDDQTREITERIIQRLETGSAQNAAAGSAVDLKQNAEALNKAMYEGSDVQNSFTGDLTMADIDALLEDLTWEELMGDEDADIESEDEAKTVLKTAVQDIKDEFDPTIYNGKLYLKPDTLDHWLSGSGFGSSDPTYSKAYIAEMNPSDFLRMTTVSESNQRRILDEAKPLDREQLEDYGKHQPIYLMIDEADSGWKVIGHEGRHRSIALARAGVTEMPVFIVDSSEIGKYMKKPHSEVTLEGQDFYENVNGNTLDLNDLTPVNNVYRDELFQRFTASDEDRNAAGANDQRILEYSSLGDLSNSEMDELLERFDYMRPFSEQVDSFMESEPYDGKNYDRESLLVGKIPEPFKLIGLPSLPVTINQDHVLKALTGKGVDGKYIPSHTFDAEEFKKLSDKVSNPIAIGYDPQSTKQLIVYVDMKSNSGEQVIVPLRIGGITTVKGKRINALKLDTTMSPTNEGGKALLRSAILSDNENKHTLFYLNKEKASASGFGDDILNTVRDSDSGLVHNISDNLSDVKFDVVDQTDSIQFKRWFKNSKITNEDGSPMIVYHGTSEDFTAFDMSKGRSTMDIQGAFFSPWDIDASGYGPNVGAYYLSIKNPASEAVAYAALRRYQGQNEAGKKAREYLISQGYDGVVNGIEGQPEEIIAFYPQQIKSAIENVGLFDSDNPDYRYSSLGDMTDNEIDEFLNGLALPLEGNNPSATIPSEGNAKRQFGSQTAQRSDELDASVRQFLKDNSGYIPDTNEAQINRAIQWIRSNKNSNESDGLAESIQKIAMEDFDYRSADGQARMVATMGLAVAKKDAIAQAALADAYNRQGTDLGRALQARKLFRLMTPAGRVATLQKMLQNTQDELAANGRKIDLKFSDWIYMAASEASNEGDFRKVQKRAAEELAAQIPANWKDKARAFRMLAMLGNPRTHVRNIIGNALFIPAVSIKNKLGAVAELGLEKGERTKTLRIAVDKSIRDFAKQDAIAMKDELTGDSRWNEGDAVRREVKPFKGFMQKLVDANGNALEFEDWFFLKGHYTRALGGWMQANGYTAEQMRNNPALLEKGRAYAVQEAQKATYRDANKLAQTLNKVSREGGVAGFLVDAVLPFKKTPANILRRGIEYSPVGIMKTLTADAVHLKQYMDAKNGKLSVMPDKAISPNQFIDHLCAGLTGSAIMAVGALLASMGIASAGMDDDDDKFDELRGGQEYSFKVNLFGQDVTYTMDWAAPMSMPFFVGAAIFDQLNGERGDFNIENLINDLGAMAEPVFNLSMLDGVNTLFQTSQYDDTNTITQIGGKIVSNYMTSYIPSLLGATARTIDPVRRKSFVKSGEGGGLMGTFRYAIEQTQNKIPGLSQQNIAYRNAWGEADESSTIEKIFENFLSPGYVSSVKEDPVLDELERLYNSTEVDDSTRSNLIPKLSNKAISGTALEAEQYDAVTIQRGQTAKNLLTELMNTDYFKSAADQDRAKMVSDVWTFATQTANNAAVGRKMDGWVLNTQTNPVQGIINRSKKTVADETKDGWKAEAVQAVQMGDFDALDVCIERLGELGVKKSSVKTAVGNAFKEDYIKAYQRDDYATMYDIEGTLEDTGLFTYADFEKWLDDMNKAIIEDEEI